MKRLVQNEVQQVFGGNQGLHFSIDLMVPTAQTPLLANFISTFLMGDLTYNLFVELVNSNIDNLNAIEVQDLFVAVKK